VLSGAVQPGGRLKEIQLAQELQVSRSTLRTSLMKLATEGIVVQIPYTGWQVMDLTPEDVWELWTLRAGLESLASKLVAERMTPALARQVEGAFLALLQACGSGEVQRVNDADFGLHRCIIDAAGNRRLSAQYRQVEQQVRFYLIWSNELVGEDLPAIGKQHEAMVAALLSRDPSCAAREAYRHNESEGGKLAAAIHRRRWA
jgi:DNA-binding GntR family transcriptional regulator